MKQVCPMLYKPRRPVAAHGIEPEFVATRRLSPGSEKMEYLRLRDTLAERIASKVGSYTKSRHSWQRMYPFSDSTAVPVG